jgi:hypothetical protein
MLVDDNASSQPAPATVEVQSSERGNGAPPSAGLSMNPWWKFLNQSVRMRK